MFDVISKEEYFSWIDRKIIPPDRERGLKHVQDAYILSRIGQESRKRILELGGGDSRVFRKLAGRNECWNVDKFEGTGAGPREIPDLPRVKIITAFMGDFSPQIPDNYFDYVISVSAIEHIPEKDLRNTFADCARVLKPTGMIIHAIDIYLFDKEDMAYPPALRTRERIKTYLGYASRPDLDIQMRRPPAIDENLSFSCRYATNPDSVMHRWNTIAPKLVKVRNRAQSVSLKAEWIKLGPRELGYSTI